MTAAVSVSTTSTVEDQNPMTLCQFQSRALPRKRVLNQQTHFQSAPLPAVRPPEIDAGNGEPEKRQIAGAGDGACRGAAFAFGAEPAVPIDDVAHEIVGRRLSAQRSGRCRD